MLGIHDHGKGEIDDARSAIGYLRERFPGPGCHVAGFSFGAWIALEVARRESALSSVCTVAPPFKYFDSGFLNHLTIPKLFLQGKADTICRGRRIAQAISLLLQTPKKWFGLKKQTTFFLHRLEDLKKAICIASGLPENIDETLGVSSYRAANSFLQTYGYFRDEALIERVAKLNDNSSPKR